jgi:rRNA maturation protein Rpf1
MLSSSISLAESSLKLTHPPVFQELRLVFPNSNRINRGNYVMKELVEACRANEVTDLVLVHEHRGIPGKFDVTDSF